MDQGDQATAKSVFSYVDLLFEDQFNHGELIELYTPTHNEFVFDGWYLDPECTRQFDHTKVYDEDLYLYGKWE